MKIFSLSGKCGKIGLCYTL